jgi:hypothetical protein
MVDNDAGKRIHLVMGLCTNQGRTNIFDNSSSYAL